MDEMLQAVIEWRDARELFFSVPPVPSDQRFPPEIWTRLGQAEDRLMKLARALGQGR